MNGKFRVIPFGFKRKDVIKYIKQLTAERNRLLDENQELEDQRLRIEEELEASRDEIRALTSMYADSVKKLDEASGGIKQITVRLASSGSDLKRAASESAQLKSQLRHIVDSVSNGCSVTEAELKEVSATLAGISGKLGACLSPVKESIAAVESIEELEK